MAKKPFPPLFVRSTVEVINENSIANAPMKLSHTTVYHVQYNWVQHTLSEDNIEHNKLLSYPNTHNKQYSVIENLYSIAIVS